MEPSSKIALLVGRGPVLLLVELLREPHAILPASAEPAAVVALALLVFGPSTTAQIAVLASTSRAGFGQADVEDLR